MTTITIPRAILLPALATANRAVERRSTIPILQNVLLSADSGRLTLATTNLDQETRVAVDAGMSGKTAYTLPALQLHDIVRKLPDGADVSIEDDGKTATIVAGRSRFRLPILPASDFPVIGEGSLSHRFELQAQALAGMLSMVGFAISSEETRYYLNGIHWHAATEQIASDEVLVAVATDGHRLAKVSLPLPAGAAGLPPIIIPRQAAGMLEKLLDDKEDAKAPVAIGLSDTKILFTTKSGRTLLSKLIDGTFPDYRRVVPAGNANRFLADKAPLFAAVDRVGTMSAGGRAIKFGFAAEAIRLAARNPDSGEAEDEVSATRADGDDVEIGFNGRYCLDALGAMPGERVEFQLGDAGTPAILRPADPHDLSPLFVIMPMRV